VIQIQYTDFIILYSIPVMIRMSCCLAAVPSRRLAHARTRRIAQLKRVAMLICIPAVFCSLPGVLGNHDGNNIQTPLQLRRCVSLSSCMNHNAKELDSIGCKRRIPIYSPVHSPPTELAHDRPQCLGTKPRTSNLDSRYIHLVPQERRDDPTIVYTQIQTQLYPQIRF
jgi:hypothetical protein